MQKRIGRLDSQPVPDDDARLMKDSIKTQFRWFQHKNEQKM